MEVLYWLHLSRLLLSSCIAVVLLCELFHAWLAQCMQLYEWWYFLNPVFKPLHSFFFFLNTFPCLRPCHDDSRHHHLGCLMLKQSSDSLDPVFSCFSCPLVLFTLSNTFFQWCIKWEAAKWTTFSFRCRTQVPFSPSHWITLLWGGQWEEAQKKRKSRKGQQELERRGRNWTDGTGR